MPRAQIKTYGPRDTIEAAKAGEKTDVVEGEGDK